MKYYPESDLIRPSRRLPGPVGIIAFCAVSIAAAYIASPWLSLHFLREAVQAGDSHAISKRVDFPAVRSSLKEQMKLHFMKAMAKDESMRDNPFAGLAAAFAPAMIDNMIDASVTADGIAYLIQEGKLQAAKAPTGSPPMAYPRDPAATVFKQGFAGFDDFEIEFVSGVKVWLRREFPLSWRVYKVAIPQNL